MQDFRSWPLKVEAVLVLGHSYLLFKNKSYSLHFIFFLPHFNLKLQSKVHLEKKGCKEELSLKSVLHLCVKVLPGDKKKVVRVTSGGSFDT